MDQFDYIIIGAGSAGCVLANRLSANPDTQVLLLEAGAKDTNMMIHMPAGVGELISTDTVNWYYNTEAQSNMGNRSLFWPRGKVLGGSSSINGMIYIRGHASDYDEWAELGLKGWSFKDVLPYFRRSEENENGASEFHGDSGPLAVTNPRHTNVLFDAFIDAGKEAGHAYTEDFNGAQQEGVGNYQLTIKDGQRCSAAKGYLTPVLQRPNLHVITEAMTSRIVFEDKRAVAVEYIHQGKTLQAKARAEVLLCGGAINSPQTLLLSGIGDAQYLKKFDIDCVADLPGVGQNMQDHLDVMVHTECLQPVTLHSQMNFFRKIWTGMRYVFTKTGLATSNGLESGAFLKTDPKLDKPDIQIHFVAAMMRDHAREKSDRHGFTTHICQLRPESKGFIGLHSTDPFDHALIQPNYLAAPKDRQVLRDGLRLARNILKQPALAAYTGTEVSPGTNIDSDEDLDRWIGEHGETIYHPIGTAKMGHDAMAVVDERCQVHGIKGLRVVDASVMPTLVGGNTNAPTIMVAEKIADDILGLEPLTA